MNRHLIKIFILLLIAGTGVSCSMNKKSALFLKEDTLIQTKKYIGDYIDHCGTETDVYGDVNIIWIKTTVYNEYGQLSAYTRDCGFSPGDRLYLKSIFHSNGSFGNWEHRIENDASVSYKVSECLYENRILVQNLVK